MMAKNEFLFDIVASEADVRIYIDREGFRAEKPGIIITSSVIGHRPNMKGDKYTLWFGGALHRETFKKFKDACLRAQEILDTANCPINPRVDGHQMKKFLKIFKKKMIMTFGIPFDAQCFSVAFIFWMLIIGRKVLRRIESWIK